VKTTINVSASLRTSLHCLESHELTASYQPLMTQTTHPSSACHLLSPSSAKSLLSRYIAPGGIPAATSQSRMPCPLNGDIAVAIIDQLSTNIAEHHRALAVLARTCRLFSEPALNMLWENPPAWNLALRMPQSMWSIQEGFWDHTLVSNGFINNLIIGPN
jgi:hypothetical protein